MTQMAYRIRRAFLLPFGLDVFLIFLLLALSFSGGGTFFQSAALVALFLVSLAAFLELSSRFVAVSAQGLTVKKFLRTKELSWEDIIHVGGLTLRSKVYLLLTTVKGFYIFSNTYDGLPGLARDILGNIDSEKVDQEVRDEMENPTRRMADIVSAWIAACVIIFVVIVRFISQ